MPSSGLPGTLTHSKDGDRSAVAGEAPGFRRQDDAPRWRALLAGYQELPGTLSMHRIHWPIGAYPASSVESRPFRAFRLPPSTIMDCFNLQAPPFDVVVLVFQFLDPRSLLAACLTSKTFHEIATPLLYEEVQLGPSSRCIRAHFLRDII